MPQSPGPSAAPFQISDTQGNLHRSTDYLGRWLLLVFHRHLGWLLWREHIAQLRDQRDRLAELNVAVLIVTYEPPAKAAAYREETGLEWPLLVDESRTMYSQYGMGSAGWRALVSWSALWAYAKLLLRGRRLAKPGSDVHQLGGDVLIDPQGVVRLCHVSSGLADRVAVDKILSIASGDEL